MQMQDYLPYFQNLFLEYYQFTLENPVYAACLAIAVWLVTTIFYSLRIGFLNRRNSIMLNARLDAQNALAAAQQEMQQLQQEIAAGKELVEQETQRTAALQERIAGIAGQLSESIVVLAAEPDLGQQGLSVAPGLEAEHLWQRYSAAVKQLGESLIAQRKANGELQQSFSAETAKLAEKDSQLQVMQTRLDSQRQQLAKLELTVEEQNSQLARQQESEKQRLSELEAKHQADLARLARLEQQTRVPTQVQEQKVQAQEKPKTPEVPVAQPEPIKPAAMQAPAVEAEPRQVKVEARPTVSEVTAPEPTIARAEMAKQQQHAEKTDVGTSGGVTGKFKSLFAGAKQQMEKLDDMFGLSTPMLPPEEPKQAARVHLEPEPAPVQMPAGEPEPISVEPPLESAVKESASGLSGKFKNLFGSSKASVTAAANVEPAPAETVVAEPEPEPQAVEEAGADAGKASGKLKNLLGRFKRTA